VIDSSATATAVPTDAMLWLNTRNMMAPKPKAIP